MQLALCLKCDLHCVLFLQIHDKLITREIDGGGTKFGFEINRNEQIPKHQLKKVDMEKTAADLPDQLFIQCQTKEQRDVLLKLVNQRILHAKDMIARMVGPSSGTKPSGGCSCFD